MKKLLLPLLFVACTLSAQADDFEDAFSAVANMRVGWNLGNSLDSNSGSLSNMWIEKWTSGTPTDYETAWGQPVTTRALIAMFRQAGFGAIRVPVTWYPHIDDNGNIDAAWLKRVHEVVDYVIDEGLYCILNVHHDTGTADTAWLKAYMTNYNSNHEKFEKLWTNIANEFIDYDQHLLFEGFNEMTDSYDSWCFASYYASGNYNATAAADTYEAINSYNQSFVDAVRATGGNNAQRNLVVNTYAACSGEGSWNSHLLDPLKNMNYPDDSVEGHIAFQVHTYPSLSSSTMTSEKQCLKDLQTYLVSKGGPVIIGEWGTSDTWSDYESNCTLLCTFVQQFTEAVRDAGMAQFFWMTLSNASDRSVPTWSTPEIKDAIIYGYYGEDGYVDASVQTPSVQTTNSNAMYNLAGQRVGSDYKGIVIKNGKKVLVK